jgi:hypothetical protein
VLVAAELVDGGLDDAQPAHELRAHPLELLDAQQRGADARVYALPLSPTGTMRGRCGGGRHARVFGLELAERALEHGDLLTQQAAAPGRVVLRLSAPLGRDVQRGGDVPRVDAGLVRLAGRVGGDARDRGGPLGGGGDERAAALLAVDQALLLEPLVDGADGVDVHAGRLGHLAQAGQALSGLELTVADTGSERPRELHADGYLGGAIDREVQRRRLG